MSERNMDKFLFAGCPVMGFLLAGLPLIRALEGADYPGWVVGLTVAAAAGAASGLLALILQHVLRRIRA